MTDLVFDLGATRGRFALVKNGQVGEIHHLDTEQSASGFARMLGFMDEIAGDTTLDGVAGGIPGQLEGEEGRLYLSPNLPNWIGLPILARMQGAFSCPVHIANDVVMGGLGESHFGVGVAKGVMAYFTVSTGVNAVRIVGGKVDPTIARYEIGEQIVAGLDGRLQTLESLTGGAAFEMRRGRAPKSVRDAAVWAVEERHLAVGIYNTVLFWNPEVIVFNGSMMRDIDLAAVRYELEQMPKIVDVWPRLARAKLRDSAGVYGATVMLAQIRDRKR